MSLVLTRRHNVDRFGYLIPTRYGNVPMVGAVATYRPGEGRFGGAVAVEEARENVLFTLSGGYVSWLADLREGQSSDLSVGGGIVRVTRLGEHRFRAEVIQDITGISAIPLTRTNFVWPANQPHVISAYIRDYHEAPGTNVAWGLGRASFGGPDLNGRNGLGRKVNLYNPISLDVISSLTLRAAGGNSLVTAGSYIEWEFAQAELNASFATSFVDGTRAAGRLEYPQSIWNHATGTFAAWVKTPTDVSTDRVLTLQWGNDDLGADTRFGIRMNTSGRFVVSYGSADTLTTADSYNDGEWHHVVLTWVDGTADIHFYVDGERVASASEPISVGNQGGRYGGVIPIGHRGYTYNDQWWNGLIAELLILPYAASEEEIRAWYEADGPIPPHPAALLQWDWQAVRPATMVAL